MFCLVELTVPRPPTMLTEKRGFFRRRRQVPAEPEPLYPERVCIGGYPAFFIFKVPYDELLSDSAKAVFSAYRGKIIFQQCIELPKELREYEFIPAEYNKLLLLKRAEELLNSAFSGKSNTTLLISDERGRRLRKSLHLVALSEKVFVKTASEDCYDAFSERAFSGYGAIVYRYRDFGDSYDAFLANAEGDGESFHAAAVLDYDNVVFSLRTQSRLGARTSCYTPVYPVIPQELIDVLPFGIDGERFLCAMYDICRFRIEN